MFKFFKTEKDPLQQKVLTLSYDTKVTLEHNERTGEIKIIDFTCPLIKDRSCPQCWKRLDNKQFKTIQEELGIKTENPIRKIMKEIFTSYKADIEYEFKNGRTFKNDVILEILNRYNVNLNDLDLFIQATIRYLHDRKEVFKNIKLTTQEPELKLSEEEFEGLRREIFGI
jgi:hypothetical protein